MIDDDEIDAMPVMQDLKRAMFAALCEVDARWMVAFLRNIADGIEEHMESIQ